MYRHGDVQLIPVSAIPADAKKINRKELAYGEVTGHAHRIDVGELFETKNGKLYLKVDRVSEVSHEEHKTSKIPAGIYCVGIKRQYDAKNGWERVID